MENQGAALAHRAFADCKSGGHPALCQTRCDSFDASRRMRLATYTLRRAVWASSGLAGAYAWQSFIKSGSIVPGGSDAPVERGEPMIEFYAAVARKDMKGFSGEGWHPEEAVTREQALKMFTVWPAYAAFEETLRGSIEIGKLADFTVLSADIMKIPEMEILKTRCVMTVIGGEIVYEAK